MKLRLIQAVDGDFAIRDKNNRRIAVAVSPELAAWIAAAAKGIDDARPCAGICACCDFSNDLSKLEFGPPLTEDCEIEI